MKFTNLNLMLVLALAFFACNCAKEESTTISEFVKNYKGSPFIDSIQAYNIQEIPGRVQCEFFDIGGDSIAYYDTDKNNNGSGSLNTGTDYLSRFRIDEAPDISYTKFHDQIDNSPYNTVQPEKDQLYLGWTEPGEWTRYTVDVTETGNYKIATMYTSNRGGAIQLFIDDTDSTEYLNITSTFHADDPIAWRNWHHWNKDDSLTTMHISKGRHVMTLKIIAEGNFNFDYIEFSKVD